MAKGGDKAQLPTKATPHGLVTKDGVKPADVDARISIYKATDYAKQMRTALGK